MQHRNNELKGLFAELVSTSLYILLIFLLAGLIAR